jgi:hypothetical protein
MNYLIKVCCQVSEWFLAGVHIHILSYSITRINHIGILELIEVLDLLLEAIVTVIVRSARQAVKPQEEQLNSETQMLAR